MQSRTSANSKGDKRNDDSDIRLTCIVTFYVVEYIRKVNLNMDTYAKLTLVPPFGPSKDAAQAWRTHLVRSPPPDPKSGQTVSIQLPAKAIQTYLLNTFNLRNIMH